MSNQLGSPQGIPFVSQHQQTLVLPHHLTMREKDGDMVTGDEVYPYLSEGFLLQEDEADDPFGYRMRWARSRAESFDAIEGSRSRSVPKAASASSF